MTGDDAAGGEEEEGVFGRAAGDEIVEHLGGGIAAVGDVDGHAGERGIAVAADGGDVSDAEDGDGLGDGEIEFGTGIEGVGAHGVGGGHEGQGLRQAGEPAADFAADFGDVEGAGHGEDGDIKTGLMDFCGEGSLAAFGGGAQG